MRCGMYVFSTTEVSTAAVLTETFDHSHPQGGTRGEGRADALPGATDTESRWQRLSADVQKCTPLIIIHCELLPVVRLKFLVIHVNC